MKHVKNSRQTNTQLTRNLSKFNYHSFLHDISKKLTAGEYKIAIYGLGHVGAPLAAAWLRAGFFVIGIDKSSTVIESARNGKSHIPEPGVNEAFTKGVSEKRFLVYDDLSKASTDSFLKMICVPVLAQDGTADLNNVKKVAKEIGRGMKKNDIISLNPSVPPGTTEKLVVPILEKNSDLKIEEDFYVVYNPERIYEGRAIEDIESRYPGVISGYGKKSLEVGSRLFSKIYKTGLITMSSIKAAETEKLFEGVYRDVNIALANELAIFSENLGIDFWEVRSAANSQPFCQIHKPGVGVGGACIPVYPQFIIHASKNLGIDSKITKLGRKINNMMPKYCVKQALKLIPSNGYKNITVTLLGLAFRGGVIDTRLSPTYDIIKEFNKFKIRHIKVHDPLIQTDVEITKYPNTTFYTDFVKSIQNTDLVMLLTDHKEYEDLINNITDIPIYDGRGILKRDKTGADKFSIIGSGTKKWIDN
ncbi:MAG: nucleotide sugar dehydrogenase [Nitrososphaeraceae archaeon]|nr:nucleotide sugar dehydrogenase [Nitrososphaeraceae archaeon]